MVGWNDYYFQVVDVLEFVGFGIGCIGYVGQFFVYVEQVLEGDVCQGLVFMLDWYVFFCFYCLVQVIGLVVVGQGVVGEFVYDDYFIVVYDVIDVVLVDCMCVQGGIEVVYYGQVLCGVQVFGFGVEDVCFDQQLFGVFYVCFGQVYLFVFFVDLEVIFVVFCFLFDQVWYDVVDVDVQFWGVVGWVGDDQWGMGFVDQD